MSDWNDHEGDENKTTFSYFSLEIFHFEHEKVQIFFLVLQYIILLVAFNIFLLSLDSHSPGG
jgi:hypothetical protein